MINQNKSLATFGNKIIIIGEAGRGKTTLAKKLSKKFDIPMLSTDDFYWEIKYTVPRNRNLAYKMLHDAYQDDKWIIEGTTQWLIEPVLEHADIILYLHFKSVIHQWFFLFKRHLSDPDESIGSSLFMIRHVFYKRYKLGYKKNSITHRDLLKPYMDKVIELTSYKDIDRYVASL